MTLLWMFNVFMAGVIKMSLRCVRESCNLKKKSAIKWEFATISFTDDSVLCEDTQDAI